MAKIQLVNRLPEMKAIDAQYKDDPQTLQLKKMALYRQLGINPLGGCLPQLLQFPVLISLFLFFPSSIELRQKPFLWADDLSTYDSILDLPFTIPFYGDHVSLFTLLMTLTSLLYIYMTQRDQGSSGPKEMRFLSYLMPIVFLFFLNHYSAGLSFYYFCVNVITIIQTLVIQKWFINEEEIIAALRAKKNEKRPPSRLEKWIMEQQKQAEALRKSRNKYK
jgi:YidC/Oxa1 family membrane protein insertase